VTPEKFVDDHGGIEHFKNPDGSFNADAFNENFDAKMRAIGHDSSIANQVGAKKDAKKAAIAEFIQAQLTPPVVAPTSAPVVATAAAREID